MIKFYEKFLGAYKIKNYKDQWKLYQLGSAKAFNWHIIGLVLLIILYFLVPNFNKYIGVALGYFFCTLLLKFGEYKGYNESLYELENE